MKIAIRIPGCSLSAELPEEKCREAFGLLIRHALGFELGFEAEGLCALPPDPPTQPAPPGVPAPPDSEDAYWQRYVDQANGVPPEERGTDDVKRYRGFLYLRCSVCGETHAFCPKQGIAFYRCEKCGESTLFPEPLKKAYFTCECGNRSTYWTNLTDKMFDINCINCGMPVTVEYNEKDGCFRGLPPGRA